jgi:hypothetical protein
MYFDLVHILRFKVDAIAAGETHVTPTASTGQIIYKVGLS